MPYFDNTSSPPLQIVPTRGLAVLIRDNLGERRQGLEEHDEVGALDTTAMMLQELHDATVGQVPAIAGDHSPRFRRLQLAGQRALGLVDFVWIVKTFPEAGMGALEALLFTLRRRSVPIEEPASIRSVPSEAVDLVIGLTDHLADWTRTIHNLRAGDTPGRRASDLGNLDNPAELRRRVRALDDLVDQAERLRAALNREVATLEESEATA